jgi:hypothetical protein
MGNTISITSDCAMQRLDLAVETDAMVECGTARLAASSAANGVSDLERPVSSYGCHRTHDTCHRRVNAVQSGGMMLSCWPLRTTDVRSVVSDVLPQHLKHRTLKEWAFLPKLF